MSLHNDLERLVDQFGIPNILNMLSLICAQKALEPHTDPAITEHDINEFTRWETSAYDIKQLANRPNIRGRTFKRS